jgi:stage V sporulation protein G
MEISEIRIKLVAESDDRLRGFCSITFREGFVIRDLRIIEGESGLFVAMPSRKVTAHCPRCQTKNHLKARFCNHCGIRLPQGRLPVDPQGRPRLYADIAHPVTQEFRDRLQRQVIEEFQAELERAKLPGYRSRYDEGFEFDAGPAEGRGGEYRRYDRAQKFSGPHRPAARPDEPAEIQAALEAQPLREGLADVPGTVETPGKTGFSE